MDLARKIGTALKKAFHPEEIKLKNDDGVVGYIVAKDFRGVEFVDRQIMIYNALRESSVKLSPQEIRSATIAALTPEEKLAHSAD